MSAQKPEKEVSYLERQLQFKQLALNALLEVTQAINNNLSAEELFRIYEFILRAQFGLDRLCVYIRDEREEMQRVCDYGLKRKKKSDKTLNIEEQLLPLESISESKQLNHPFFGQFETVIPVYQKEEPLAYALIGKVKQTEQLRRDALQFIQTLTSIIAVAIENKKLFRQQLHQEALRREVELAADIQTMLIPKVLPEDDYFEMTAVYQPHAQVGGDYYDVFSLNHKEVVFCIADISGKGIAAAMLMSNFQANLRALMEQDYGLDEVVRMLNEKMLKNTEGQKFITLFLGKYHRDNKVLKYVNAGHNPPFLVNKSSFDRLEAGTTVLGMFDELPFINMGKVDIKRNSLLFLFTDGLIDLENEKEERFKTERVKKFLEKEAQKKPGQIRDNLLEQLNSFRQEQSFTDDITVLACRFKK